MLKYHGLQITEAVTLQDAQVNKAVRYGRKNRYKGFWSWFWNPVARRLWADHWKLWGSTCQIIKTCYGYEHQMFIKARDKVQGVWKLSTQYLMLLFSTWSVLFQSAGKICPPTEWSSNLWGLPWPQLELLPHLYFCNTFYITPSRGLLTEPLPPSLAQRKLPQKLPQIGTILLFLSCV